MLHSTLLHSHGRRGQFLWAARAEACPVVGEESSKTSRADTGGGFCSSSLGVIFHLTVVEEEEGV